MTIQVRFLSTDNSYTMEDVVSYEVIDGVAFIHGEGYECKFTDVKVTEL